LLLSGARIVRELAKERGDEGTPEGGMGFPIPMEMLEEILDALKEGASTVEVNNFDELSDAEQSDDWKEQAQSKAKESAERLENKEISTEIFSKSSGPGKSRTDSKLLETRTPTGAERSASVLIGRWLEKAKYRERDIIEKSSEVPPGRLRTRAISSTRSITLSRSYYKVRTFPKESSQAHRRPNSQSWNYG
jgi:HD superfamily phosphohydrolase